MQAGSPDRVERRLAAILATDVVGHRRLVDEVGTARLMREHPGVPHGMCTTRKDEVNSDLLIFIRG